MTSPSPNKLAPGRLKPMASPGIFALCSVLATTAMLLCAGCSGNKPEAPPAVSVRAATVQQKTIQQIVSTEAVLYPKTEASIVPKISAPVEKFYVNRGSHVHAGELVAQLENKDLQAALDQAKGTYEQAQAAYDTSIQMSVPADVQAAELNAKQTKQAMEAARDVYQSRLKLYQQGAIALNQVNDSHVNYVQANNQYEQAEAHLKGMQKIGQSAELDTAKGQLASAKGAYEAALANLQYSEIRSPITGVVTDRPLYEGQMAAAGTPLITVMDLSHAIGRAYVSPQQASLLHVGDSATLVLGQGQSDAPAKVSVVSPALDPNSTTIQVWVDAVNSGDRLKPGSTVTVQIVAKTVKNALVVPTDAILTAQDGTTSVMVVGKDQAAHQTTVKTGIREGADVQILSGLSGGEQLVTQGAYGLPDGTKIAISKSAEPPSGTSDGGKE
ncbi:MAG TPA: efflux RND transporter periplasmic adaptor subunit [Candidatus Acidoferrum sp.]|nr:efflux RND transporter periplasmic adaptor subunit [Candidatus Acidoferrum sp.]